jgi:hypothetical protein
MIFFMHALLAGILITGILIRKQKFRDSFLFEEKRSSAAKAEQCSKQTSRVSLSLVTLQ